MASVASPTVDKENEQNYIRLNLLVVKLSSFVLKARFDHTVPPAQLHHQLNKFIGTINYGKNKKIINQKQYDLLFPQNAPPTSDKFDITLLVYLLKHICGLDGKCKWWKEKDNSKIPDTVVEEIADIVRIRNIRNEIQHLQKASIDQKDFEEKWDINEKAMLRLGAICNLPGLMSEIDTVKNQPFETVKEKVIVIMQSHGLEDDFGDFDDYEDRYDDVYGDYDDYEDDRYDDLGNDYDDYDDHANECDIYGDEDDHYDKYEDLGDWDYDHDNQYDGNDYYDEW
ncbi:coiled-coil domain-containing protein 1-like [Mercenaria mercenaria]|uniref:coiled-coil domain-containing protein 1-like n=1 Tax=Mercenaria mercenaria TaxID=6596 RepID=UPI00234F1243|nr:coiled-coil domain-containing protein 1-like [Mercenaria mercenaria]XP_045157016.2 coiled-coil domain-containing protein 1-like [Mercenaria mercenaria]XP_053395017.1 coiled-coil domain-containing protein 1-like [Mercenaria mercenaria]